VVVDVATLFIRSKRSSCAERSAKRQTQRAAGESVLKFRKWFDEMNTVLNKIFVAEIVKTSSTRRQVDRLLLLR